MKASELRASLLQEAVSGRLVPQMDSEGSAADLLQKIAAERVALVAAGKLKKEKPLPAITEEEIPFGIPESWKWVRLGEIVINRDGERIPLSVSEREGLDKIYDYYGASGVIDKVDRYLFDKRLLLIGEDGANLYSRSTPLAYFAEGKYWVNNHAHVIDAGEHLSLDYLAIFINATPLNAYITGMAQPKLSQGMMNKIPVPLPPLSEQRRIVAKLEELLPLVDAYEKEEEALSKLNASFPERMRRSILQEAVSGKLVPQIAEEGTAADLLKEIEAEKKALVAAGKMKKEKPLPVITEEEKPFEIPESWEWVRLGEIGFWSAGGTPNRAHQEYYTNGTISWLKSGDLNDRYITSSEEKITQTATIKSSAKINPLGTVILAMYGATIGKTGILSIEAATNQACCACQTYTGIFNRYLQSYLISQRKELTELGWGSAQPNISREKIVNYLFPLPPLAEQRRIVAKIEELLKIIDRM